MARRYPSYKDMSDNLAQMLKSERPEMDQAHYLLCNKTGYKVIFLQEI